MGVLLDLYADNIGRVLALRDWLMQEQGACDEEAVHDMLEAVETCQVRRARPAVCVFVGVRTPCMCVSVRTRARMRACV